MFITFPVKQNWAMCASEPTQQVWHTRSTRQTQIRGLFGDCNICTIYTLFFLSYCNLLQEKGLGKAQRNKSLEPTCKQQAGLLCRLDLAEAVCLQNHWAAHLLHPLQEDETAACSPPSSQSPEQPGGPSTFNPLQHSSQISQSIHLLNDKARFLGTFKFKFQWTATYRVVNVQTD